MYTSTNENQEKNDQKSSDGNNTLFQKEKNVKWKSKYPEPIAWGSCFEVSLALQKTKILFLIISTKIIAKTDVWFTRRIDSRAVKRDQLINVKQLVAAGMIMHNIATKKHVSFKPIISISLMWQPHNSEDDSLNINFFFEHADVTMWHRCDRWRDVLKRNFFDYEILNIKNVTNFTRIFSSWNSNNHEKFPQSLFSFRPKSFLVFTQSL